MSAVWELDIPATEKMVLLALADNANDEGLCWPAIKTIARKCSRSERAVQYAVKALEALGLLKVDVLHGKTHRFWVTLEGCNHCTLGVQPLHQGGATTAPKPSYNHQGTNLETNVSCPSDDELELEIEEEVMEALKPEHIHEAWNDLAERLAKPKILKLTPERRQLAKARIAQYSLDEFQTVLANIERSPFLRGEGKWQGCTFDWVMKKANFQKILEGNYNR